MQQHAGTPDPSASGPSSLRRRPKVGRHDYIGTPYRASLIAAPPARPRRRSAVR